MSYQVPDEPWPDDPVPFVATCGRCGGPTVRTQGPLVCNCVRVSAVVDAISRAQDYPRLRYMGSKYRLLPDLAKAFDEIGGRRALDAFSGSGVVSYLLKALGFEVTSNDYLNFPAQIAMAAVTNRNARLSDADVARVTGRPADRRDFIARTFDGLYFDDADRKFLDAAWSHVDNLRGSKRALAVASLVLAAARKQPRGVFTFTDISRYHDGRRQLSLPLRDHFVECATEWNSVVFDSGQRCRAFTGDISVVDPRGFDLVYLDPPYAPPRDDNDYIKRYHFLEGLAVYWRGQTIMEGTLTKKLAKRFTPFAYKHTIVEALRDTFKRFSHSTIVLSYSSNSVPSAEVIVELLGDVKGKVEVREIHHRYHFGTHAAAERRQATEYLFIGY